MCELCLPKRRAVLKGSAALLAIPFVRGPTFRRADAVRVTDQLAIQPRSTWAGEARPVKGTIPSEDVRFLLVHHTAGGNSYRQDDVPGIIRGMYDFHTGPEKLWPDVAYNFLIDRFGGVWEAREGALAGTVQGDATGGNQGYSQLVSLMGNFSADPPSEAARESLVATLAWLADRSDVDTSPGSTATFSSLGSNRHPKGSAVTTPTVNGHRSMSQTSCPGDALFAYVADGLMQDVSAARGGNIEAAQAAPIDRSQSPETSGSSTTTESPATSRPSESTSSTETSTSSTETELNSPTSTTDTELNTPTSTDTSPTDGANGTSSSEADSASVSPRPSATDTVNGVASPSSSGSPASNDLSGTEVLGLAGAGMAAALTGLLAVRRRGGPDTEPKT